MSKELEMQNLAVEHLMKNESGRAWLYSLIQATGVDGDTFNADPYKNAYNMGMRSAGIRLSQELQSVNIDLYLLMIKEAK